MKHFLKKIRKLFIAMLLVLFIFGLPTVNNLFAQNTVPQQFRNLPLEYRLLESRRYRVYGIPSKPVRKQSPTPTSRLRNTPTPTVRTTRILTPTSTPKPTAQTIQTYVTFYGWPDNSPAGDAIAYPGKALHRAAGGVGTYADPITMASDPGEWPIGTKLYVPYLKKYVIMEDWCSICVENWKSKKYHIDIWMNSNSSFEAELLACQRRWTRSSVPVEINPSADRPVASTPLFNTTTGVCL